ncbi:MAG: hypothetical protein COT74_02680 [Bdellovibrionales bacterium CG10_big_fil_rev_8_21_14_0_10_45_34]|nr:MAG: hypothetical protein COT74_02680 [Bdellovibrionales bacterium CG10_big_fil_rev_8_21_14_0_10_45_34]
MSKSRKIRESALNSTLKSLEQAFEDYEKVLSQPASRVGESIKPLKLKQQAESLFKKLKSQLKELS